MHHRNHDGWSLVIIEGLILRNVWIDLRVSILLKLWTSGSEVFQILIVRRLPPPQGGVILIRQASSWSHGIVDLYSSIVDC